MRLNPEPQVLLCENHFLGVSKPACMPVVPDESKDFSLLDWGKEWVRREFKKPGNVFLGVIHRLDRPVSGVVVFGRTSKGAARLSESWRQGKVAKTYLGVCEGALDQEAGTLVQWLWKDVQRNIVQTVPEDAPGAREARTSWKVIREVGNKTLVELTPETGRSHQLRVACASLGAPLVGDVKYGASAPLDDRSIGLHASSLCFPHPVKDEEVRLACGPPFPKKLLGG